MSADVLEERLYALRSKSWSGSGKSRMAVLIVGPARTGKSIIARELVGRHGYSRVCIDDERWRFVQNSSEDAWKQARPEFIFRLLACANKNVVIEGDDLLAFFLTIDEPTLKNRLEPMLREFCTVFVGCAQGAPDEKAEAILKFRKSNKCWTKTAKPSEADVFYLAKYIIKKSREALEISKKMNGVYFEIGSSTFSEDISAVLDYISETTAPSPQ